MSEGELRAFDTAHAKAANSSDIHSDIQAIPYVTADVFLNRNWEEDFPEDPTGRFEEFKKFVRSNFEMCKWIGSLIVAAPRYVNKRIYKALSILLAMILQALGPDRGGYYDSDDDYTPARLPLLKPPVQQPPYAVDSHFKLKNDVWNVRINEFFTFNSTVIIPSYLPFRIPL
ncbi:tetraspanin-19-like protein [Cinnamomum micranthum f. kanehirae]|uniref:Tetraspanin-19-like protein n=1 Tax=Cinnamomum micranthum f. kanehirae TaxID=337451 RepID=A0A443P0F8_9MAGN|nr:tetraspanin-19-like protein [Cinnamomum micranthum f. kanehirae]